MKSLTVLSLAILADCEMMAGGIHSPHDSKTIVSRIETEGEGFLTLTLPRLLKDLDSCLDLGNFDSTAWLGFKRRAGLPVFLRGFLSRIFDAHTGQLRDDYGVWTSVHALRQFLASFGKIKELADNDKCELAIAEYIRTDEEMGSVRVSDENLNAVRSVFFTLYRKGIRQTEHAIELLELVPRHGNGSVADRVKPNSRWHLETWHDRLESVFPYFHYAVSSPSFIEGELTSTTFLSPGEEHPVRVVLVPKTAKAPRVIAMEPACMQFMQQALMKTLVRTIPKDTFGMVLFRDQTQNRAFARKGAITGTLATLDLSEASDRVALSVVQELTRNFPIFQEGIFACRSQYAKLPDGSTIHLKKFASMGSALCFPVEAMVFSSIVIAGILQARQLPVSRQSISKLVGEVSVYGDDIICPVDSVPRVTELLEAFGLRVNYNKSFWIGRFRESCGGEYYNDREITPVRVRTRLPNTLSNAEAFLSSVSTRNQFYDKGMFTIVEYMDSILDSLYPLPFVPIGSAVFGKWDHNGYQGTERWNSALQRSEIRTLKVVPKKIRDSIDGGPALLKFFSTRGAEPLAADAYAYAGRARSVSLKTCWAAK